MGETVKPQAELFVVGANGAGRPVLRAVSEMSRAQATSAIRYYADAVIELDRQAAGPLLGCSRAERLPLLRIAAAAKEVSEAKAVFGRLLRAIEAELPPWGRRQCEDVTLAVLLFWRRA